MMEENVINVHYLHGGWFCYNVSLRGNSWSGRLFLGEAGSTTGSDQNAVYTYSL